MAATVESSLKTAMTCQCACCSQQLGPVELRAASSMGWWVIWKGIEMLFADFLLWANQQRRLWNSTVTNIPRNWSDPECRADLPLQASSPWTDVCGCLNTFLSLLSLLACLLCCKWDTHAPIDMWKKVQRCSYSSVGLPAAASCVLYMSARAVRSKGNKLFRVQWSVKISRQKVGDDSQRGDTAFCSPFVVGGYFNQQATVERWPTAGESCEALCFYTSAELETASAHENTAAAEEEEEAGELLAPLK